MALGGIQTEIITYLSSDSIVSILTNLESDDAISILENVPEEEKNNILSSLPPKDRFALLESLSYPEDTAARLSEGEKFAKSIPAQKCFPSPDKTITLADALSEISSIKCGNSDQKALFIELNSSGLDNFICATFSFIS